jgi:ArsR family transcriptional regulator
MPNSSTISTNSHTSLTQQVSRADAPAEGIDIGTLSQRFKACGDPLRLQILQVLKNDTFGVLELTQLFETKQSGMSHHLKVLSSAGLVEAQREGNAIFYRRPFSKVDIADQLTTAQLFQLVDRIPLPAALDKRIETIREQRAVLSQAFFDKSSERFSEQQEMICDYEQYAGASFELLEKSELSREKVILELGSGEGHFLKPLSLNHTHVVALDTSETLLQKAKRFADSEGLKNIEFVTGDTSTFRSLERTVDAVIMNMVLHHVPTPSKIFEDCFSFLNEGGVMVICDLSHHHQDWAKDRCGDLWLGFEPQELSSWAQRVGFEEDESVFIGLRNGFQIQLRKFVKPLLSKATQ